MYTLTGSHIHSKICWLDIGNPCIRTCLWVQLWSSLRQHVTWLDSMHSNCENENSFWSARFIWYSNNTLNVVPVLSSLSFCTTLRSRNKTEHDKAQYHAMEWNHVVPEGKLLYGYEGQQMFLFNKHSVSTEPSPTYAFCTIGCFHQWQEISVKSGAGKIHWDKIYFLGKSDFTVSTIQAFGNDKANRACSYQSDLIRIYMITKLM